MLLYYESFVQTDEKQSLYGTVFLLAHPAHADERAGTGRQMTVVGSCCF